MAKVTNQSTFLMDLAKLGLTPAECRLVYDLVQHGKDEVIAKIEQVGKRAPTHVQELVASMILASFNVQTPEIKKSIDDLMSIALAVTMTYCKMRKEIEEAGAQQKG